MVDNLGRRYANRRTATLFQEGLIVPRVYRLHRSTVAVGAPPTCIGTYKDTFYILDSRIWNKLWVSPPKTFWCY